jgi:hypothetical protein
MAEKIVSPGVYTNEIDQSFLPATLGPIGAAIVGPTVMGPILTPTVVSSYSEYVQIFGELVSSGSDSYQYLTSHTAKEYLRQGGPCTIVRVSEPNTARATADIGTAPVTAVSARAASWAATIDTLPDGGDTLILNVESGTYTITFAAAVSDDPLQWTSATGDGPWTATISLDSETTSTLAAVIEPLLETIPNYVASNSGADITFTAGTSVELTYDIATPTGTGVSHFTSVIATGVAAVTGVSDDRVFTLEALGDGPSFNSTSSIGTDSILTPLTSSNYVNATNKGNDHYSSGSFGGSSTNFRWEVSQRNLKKGTFTLILRRGDDNHKSKQVIETFTNLSLDPESSNYILKRIGDSHQTIKAEEGVAYLEDSGSFPIKSKNVRVKQLYKKTSNYLNNSSGEVDMEQYSDSGSYFPALGSGSYGGAFGQVTGGANTQIAGNFGDENNVHPFNFYLTSDPALNTQGVRLSLDGEGAAKDSDMKVSGASVGGGYMTALSILKNKDQYDFNILFMPGIIDQAAGVGHNVIAQEAIQLCEDRGDCFFVMDNSKAGSTVADVKVYSEVRNSSYAAVYYPWVQIQDTSLGAYRYVPPSVVMAGVYHFNDVIGQPWFAPAGLNRGGIDSAVQAYKKLSQSQRDELYDSNTNPIATFPGQGVTAFGQKTLQKKASALDRVNVRRLLIDVKKFVARSSRGLVFEQNTTDLRNQFLNVVNPYMEQVQANSGLNAFKVVMDDSNNTPDTIDRNMLVGQIFLQPTRTAEFIVLDFIVQPTGAEFPE